MYNECTEKMRCAMDSAIFERHSLVIGTEIRGVPLRLFFEERGRGGELVSVRSHF